MPSKKRYIASIFVLAIFAMAAFVAGTSAAAEDDMLLHSFNNNHTDGYAPYAGLIADAAGNLYGTTQVGGAYNGGTVFELSPKVGGGWTETVLYSFGNGTDGAFPFGGLIFDKAGNLYGVTSKGNYADVAGIAFELSPTTGAEWTETVLHVFVTAPTVPGRAAAWSSMLPAIFMARPYQEAPAIVAALARAAELCLSCHSGLARAGPKL
jgi:uncharacterized repeat protein (TIGR03803 family)